MSSNGLRAEPGGDRGDLLDVGDDEEGGEENPNYGSQRRQHSDKEGCDPLRGADRRKVGQSIADHLPKGEGAFRTENKAESQQDRHEDALDEGDEEEGKVDPDLDRLAEQRSIASASKFFPSDSQG